MNKNALTILFCLGMLAPLASCGKESIGRITFELDGGSFSDPNFSTTYVQGKSGTPVLVDIPDPVKPGYYFVGWREKNADGSYVIPNKKLADDNKEYYYYPYVDDVFYAYFEPLVTLNFDLGIAAERNGKIIAPKLGDSFADNKLSGYAGKEILNLDYLPTAEAPNGHLTFDGWHTEYPLMESIDENKQKHFSLDITQPKGVYDFEEGFNGSSLAFPFTENGSVTLYATWIEDPTVTLHYNIEGISNSSFQVKGNIYESLVNEVNDKLGINLKEEGKDHFYYKSETVDKRLNGFYRDEELKKIFPIDASVTDQNIDLYLGWDESIDVVMDYAGGNVEGETTETIHGYYEGDVLGDDFYSAHTPNKEHAEFTHFAYQIDGGEVSEKFDFANQTLPDKDVKFIARYEDDPVLTLTYTYPSSYAGTQLESKTYYKKPGEDFTSEVNAFIALVTDESLEVVGVLGANGKDYHSRIMPSENLTLSIKLAYKSHVKVKTYVGDDGTYVEATGVDEVFFYYGIEDGLVEESHPEISACMQPLVLAGTEYLFDGFFLDEAFTIPAVFPFYEAPSDIESVETLLYCRMSKSVKLTFVRKDSGEEIGTLSILKGKRVSDYQTEITNLVGAYTKLSILVEGNESEVSTVLPSVDSTIYVEY